MNKLNTFLSASLLSLTSVLAAAQNIQYDTDKTLIITLQYQHGAFDIVNSRMLNEHLPKRYTYISKHDETNFQKGNDAIQTIEDQNVVKKVISIVNTQAQYAAHRVAGASLIVRYPYQEKAYSAPLKQQHLSTTTDFEMASNDNQPNETSAATSQFENGYKSESDYDYESNATSSFEKRKEPTTLAEKLELSPTIQTKSGKPLYSDLI